jgi:hypothetical protein
MQVPDHSKQVRQANHSDCLGHMLKRILGKLEPTQSLKKVGKHDLILVLRQFGFLVHDLG